MANMSVSASRRLGNPQLFISFSRLRARIPCRSVERSAGMAFHPAPMKRGSPEEIGIANLVGIAKRVLRAWMGLIHDAVLPAEPFRECHRAIQHDRPTRTSAAVCTQGIFRCSAHEPVDRLGKGERPVATQDHIGLFGGINRNFESDCLRHMR